MLQSDLKDIFVIAEACGRNIGDRKYDPNLGINGHGKIDLKDYFTTCKNYDKFW